MTKQAVFALTLATFAVTAFVNTSRAEESFGFNGSVEQRTPDVSERAIRRAVRDLELERRSGGVVFPSVFRRNVVNERVARLRVFTVDTRDQHACAALKQILEKLSPARVEDKASQLCDENSEERVKSVLLIDEFDSDAFRSELNRNLLVASDKNLIDGTRDLALGKSPDTGILWSSSHGVAKWDQPKTSEDQSPLDRKPFQRSGADTVFKVAQPLASAATYTMARHQGKSPLESLGYSVATSTFFWEYSVEGMVQSPKVQDLLVKPFVGAVLGEYFYNLERRIDDNGGQIMGSKAAGSVAMVVLNPAGTLASAMNQAAGKRFVQKSRSDLMLRRYNVEGKQANLVGIQFTFELAH